MEAILQCLFLFISGATCGWVIEVGYRTVKDKKLTNPGFLNGPYLPIYGFAVIILDFFCDLDYSFIGGKAAQVLFYTMVVTVLITLIELVAGLFFINILKIKLWDYSDMPLNFKGVICPFYSVIWGVLSVVYYFLINPWLPALSQRSSADLLMVLLIGVIYGILFFDLYNTFKAGVRIRAIAAKIKAVISYEKLKQRYKQKAIEDKLKIGFFNPFKNNSFSYKFKEAVTESRIHKMALVWKEKKKKRTKSNEDKKG